jgi:hypothetical protein
MKEKIKNIINSDWFAYLPVIGLIIFAVIVNNNGISMSDIKTFLTYSIIGIIGITIFSIEVLFIRKDSYFYITPLIAFSLIGNIENSTLLIKPFFKDFLILTFASYLFSRIIKYIENKDFFKENDALALGVVLTLAFLTLFFGYIFIKTLFFKI